MMPLNSEMYRIIVEQDQGRREININKNLTINNLLANLQDKEQTDLILIHNSSRLQGWEKIIDKLSDGATVTL